jgi:predicted ATPase/DNA-binding SARP family transcriptional activator
VFGDGVGVTLSGHLVPSEADVEICVLGPLQVLRAGELVELPGRRQRALVAALAVRNGSVTVSELVDAVWGDEPPERARTTLQTYVSRLRSALGQEAVEHSSAGYRLGPAVATDVGAARAVAAALGGPAHPDHQARADAALGVLARWPGRALAELADVEWFRASSVELDELRANLVDAAAASLLHLGRAPEAVTMLRTAVAADPWREATQILLVRALHAARRTTEAVRAASHYRRQLGETTGLVPGRAFDEAEQLALAGAPSPDVGELPPDALAPPADDATSVPGDWSSAVLARPTPLIGRADELATLERLVASERLVTVKGTGGAGKSRLVAELVHRRRAPTLVVEMAPVAPGGATSAMAAALGFHAGAADPSVIVELLGARDVLVVVDSVEHVAAEVGEIARMLVDRCRGITLVATSRARLELSDEVVLALEPLSTEGDRSAAAELLVDRIERARPRFEVDQDDPAIGELCRRVEGVPLALELVAGRAAALGVSALVDRIGPTLELLVHVEPGRGRHDTLGNVVAWSVDLLGHPARALLAALSVFRGEFDLAAAEAVGRAVVDEPVALLLGRLVDTSLVSASSTPGRFRLLEMVRSFAAERLAAIERVGEVRRAHAEWVAGRLEDIDAESVGPAEAATVALLDHARHESLSALRWTVGAGDVATATRIASALAGPLLYRPDLELVEAVAWLGDRPSVAGAADEGGALAAAARAAFLLGRLDDADDLARRAGESTDDSVARHRAAHALGVIHLYRGDFDESIARFDVVTSDPQASLVDRLDAVGGRALARCYLGDRSRARRDLATMRGLGEAAGSETYAAFADFVEGEILLAAGDSVAATAVLAAAAERAARARASFVQGIAGTVLAGVLARERPTAETRRHLQVVVERWRHTATWPQLWTTLRHVAEHLALTDQPRAALFVLAAAERDPAAPTLAGADADRYAALVDGLCATVGEAEAAGIAAGAERSDRGAVLDRALTALAAPLAA